MAGRSIAGLSSDEAARRQALYGPNAISRPPSSNILSIVIRTLREPMFFLLAIAALLYLALGDLGEGVLMVGGASLSISLVVFQELRSEHALEALQKLAEPMAHCLRDGAQKKIPARELVPGDMVLISEGERMPADAVLVAGDALVIDESILTGESAPVTKTLGAMREGFIFPDPGGSNTPFLYAGSMIVRGSSVAEVARTGYETAVGRLGASLATIDAEPSPLQRRTGEMVTKLGAFALLFCVFIIIAYGLVHGDWVEGGFAGITLAIGLLPEEFPMVLAIFLALGAFRLARRNVLVRRSSVTETLGSTSMLCTDKTGTLTLNQMKVVALSTGASIYPIPSAPTAAQHRLIDAALHASSQAPVDPMDRAVHMLANALGIGSEATQIESFPIRPDMLAYIQSWREGCESFKAAKGAPEAIYRLADVTDVDRQRYQALVEEMAGDGFRVLAVAKTLCVANNALNDAAYEFLGLLAFEDPIRPGVQEAVACARRAGVAVAMITGDYPATAQAIARSAGIDVDAGVLTGADIAATPSELLAEKIRNIRVFARITPTSKLALVEAFKADGHIVAMTGDGVNDAPALASAHIGIAMGQRGSDVAREAAHIVLLDDQFSSIVAGIELGRRIFSNLRKALTYVTAIHVPIAGLALAPILMGLPPLLLPAHVVLMELLIDPTCSLAFEAEPGEKDAMLKPPRARSEPLFGARDLSFGVIQGLAVFLGVMAIYVIEISFSAPEPQARGLAFAALILGNLTLALSDALPKGVSIFARANISFWVIFVAALSVVVLGLYFPPLAELLHFEAPEPEKLPFAALLAISAGGWYGMWRRLINI